jgi:hypothetical protein
MKTLKSFTIGLFISSMTVAIILFSCCQRPKSPVSLVRVIQNDSVLEVNNGIVKSEITLMSSRVIQKFYAFSDDHWELIAESFFRPEDSRPDVAPLFAVGPDYANEFRLMANEGFRSFKVLASSEDEAQIQITGTIGEHQVDQTLSLKKDQDFFHIEVNTTLSGTPPKLEYLLSSYIFSPPGEPDYTFVPAVKRSDDDVVGDRKFFAPAAIVEKNGLMLAMVPDLDLINNHIIYADGARPQKHPKIFAVALEEYKNSLPIALDLSLNSGVTEQPLLSYGFIDYWVEQHVYWRHENENGAQVRTLSDNSLIYGFDLFLKSDVTRYRGYQRISSFLWDKYGSKHFHLPRPQAMPFAEYARICYPASFAYQGYDVTEGPTIMHRSGKPELESWQDWELDGKQVGGLRLSAPQWYQFIYNTGWWNNVCDATGIYFWGKKLNDSSLIDKARRIINFSLSAPQNEGMFPGLYNIEDKTWVRSLWEPPLHGYDPDSTECYWSYYKSDGAYQTASASVTAGFLLHYRKNCEDHPGILPYVQHYGDFLVKNVQSNGCVPGWFNETLEPLPSLSWNADGGAHIWVLSELYRATGENKYLEAARQMALFMMEEVMPAQKWYDFETFYSCAVKPETFYDHRTGQYPANNMSVSWALEGFASLYEVTDETDYLEAAEAIADYSLFYQAVWDPHYIITAYPFGGFNPQNSDAEWLDQRSHRFANGLLRIGLLSGRQDLLERAVAATRSSLTLVNHPLHVQNDIYKYPNFPVGLGPENIDHEGFPQIPLRSGPSWCEIGGLAAAAHVLNRLGGVSINFEGDIAVGVDGVSVENYELTGTKISISLRSLIAELPVPFDEPFAIEMRLSGLSEENYDLELNNAEAVSYSKNELNSLPIFIYPDGRILLKQSN